MNIGRTSDRLVVQEFGSRTIFGITNLPPKDSTRVQKPVIPSGTRYSVRCRCCTDPVRSHMLPRFLFAVTLEQGLVQADSQVVKLLPCRAAAHRSALFRPELTDILARRRNRRIMPAMPPPSTRTRLTHLPSLLVQLIFMCAYRYGFIFHLIISDTFCVSASPRETAVSREKSGKMTPAPPQEAGGAAGAVCHHFSPLLLSLQSPFSQYFSLCGLLRESTKTDLLHYRKAASHILFTLFAMPAFFQPL